jgi:hypothetical protein
MNPLGPPDNLIQAKPTPVVPSDQVSLEDFKKRLTDEYRMLQEKIDKIGAFRFTIKGWSVTVVIAASAASATAKGLSTVLTLSFGLAVMLVFFFFFELEQVRLSNRYMDRSRRLENAFVRIDRKRQSTNKLPFPVPYTVNEIALAGRGQRVQHVGRFNRIEPARPLLYRLKEKWRLWHRTHVSFYAVLFCLSFVLPLVPRHADIRTHWDAWTMKSPAQSSGPARTTR